MTRIVPSRAAIREVVSAARADGATIALVPTMGALHEGHRSLVRAARERADFVVVSIFVNPTQFGPNEDFDRYPRDLDGDAVSLEPLGVDAVFAPSTEEMYPPGADTRVVPGAVAERWEGAVRPGHFEGVATIVAKLLNIVAPDVALFGEKDYQQLQVITRLVADLDMPTEIVGCPIVRDADGLALSSRNAYLSSDERAIALSIPRSLGAARAAFEAGERDAHALARVIAEGTEADGVVLDYAAVVDAATLEPLDAIERPARAIVAGKVGTTRLIDNIGLVPDE